MKTTIHHYQFKIDTENRKFFLLLFNHGKVLETIVEDDPEMFAAMIDLCRNESPLAFDDREMLLSTTEHEPLGEGQEPSPGDDQILPVPPLTDIDLLKSNGRYRHVNQYMCEIDVKNKKFKVTLHLDENLRGAFITECSKAFSIIMDTLRNFGLLVVV
ncbi:MAG: hypothetical protein ACKO3T_01090 [Planctomycetaceae bacterium]